MQQDVFTGNIQKDSYFFISDGIKDVTYILDGQSSPSMCLDFASGSKTKDWTKGFMSLYGYDFRSNNSLFVDYSAYVTGNCLFAFTFGQPLNCTELTYPRKIGIPRITFTFTGPTSESYKALIYCEHDECLAITANREIIRNYTL